MKNMDQCFKCSANETNAILFDAVLLEGIVKICGRCAGEENVPIMKESFSSQKRKQPTIYERLKKISGVDLDRGKDEEKKKQETALRNVVDSNFEKGFRNDLQSKKNLIHNFHWIIIRARRSKHLTREQLAEAIREPAKAVMFLEQGLVPEKKEIFEKIENFLGIKLRKQIEKSDESFEQLGGAEKKQKEFDFKNVKNLTIADLQEMKKKRDEGIFEE